METTILFFIGRFLVSEFVSWAGSPEGSIFVSDVYFVHYRGMLLPFRESHAESGVFVTRV